MTAGGETNAVVILLAALTAVALLLALAAIIAFAFLFYTTDRRKVDELEQVVGSQSQRVENLEQTDKRILSEHGAIGEQFAEQTSDLRGVLRVLRPASARLPPRRSSLMRFEQRGFLVPKIFPRGLALRRANITPHRDGYGIAWPRSVSLFASTTRGQPLQLLIAQAGSANRRTITVGRRRVVEVRRSPLLFAWTTRGRRYTVLAPPRLRQAAVALVMAMR